MAEVIKSSECLFVTRPSLPTYEEYCEEIKSIFESKWLTNDGEKLLEFEQSLKVYLKCSELVLFTNGHLALEGILEAYNFPKGSEIITTPFTFASTTHAIVRSGHVPVFCDISSDSLTMDAAKIEQLITEKTRAILPIHVYGNICDHEQIAKIADRYDLKVIYDAAHAFGESDSGVSVSSIGDASIFSFHATKVFNSIEGGCVCTRDEMVANRLREARNFGIHGEESVKYVGGNAKMNEFQAAMGICNLRHISSEIEKRKNVYGCYEKLLSKQEIKPMLLIKEGQKRNYSYMPIVVDGNRDKLYDNMRSHGIMVRKYFYPLTSDFECYRGRYGDSSVITPIARDISNSILTLPIYADMTEGDVERVCACLA